uniref:Neuralized E3 ubiquitin protein ligase 3 n=1 Tax=Loxodonta africana TaxID=9785 RepID=G3UM91_LOXAF
MGAQLCSEAEAVVRNQSLRMRLSWLGGQFKEVLRGCLAPGEAGWLEDCLLHSQLPAPLQEVYGKLRELRTPHGVAGGLNVGFCRPRPRCEALPIGTPAACPDLPQGAVTWAGLWEGRGSSGQLGEMTHPSRGRLFAEVNAGPRILLRKGVLMGAPLWAVMDVYGTTKAIELLDPAASWFPTTKPWFLSDDAVPEPEARAGEEECAICFHHAANTCLLPCGHTHFCSSCARRVFRDTAKCPMCRWQIEAVALAWGPPAVRSGEGS